MTSQTSNMDVSRRSTKQEQRDAYLQSLLETLRQAVPDALALPDVRSQAEAFVKEQTFPSARQEDWRFSDPTSMLSIPFKAISSPDDTDTGALSPTPLPEAAARLVFVNGQFNAALSETDTLPVGVVVGNLATLSQEATGQTLLSRFAQSSGKHEVFTALNTVGFQDAAVIWLPKDQVLDQPVQVVYLSVEQATPVLASPRCLVIAETGSALTLVEDFCASGTHDHFNNSVTEVWADESSQVTHVRIQREGSGTFHIGKTVVTQASNSRYTALPVSLGARFSRHNIEVYQAGPQTDTNLHGLTAIADTQLADTHSLIAFNHPHGTADQLHKCIVGDQAHSVFNGKVWVPQDAQLTNASQLNRNLLLSNKGRVDTKPELDIVADNVKCAHGATVSQLSADELFYLQSRGVDADAAQRLLIYGFAMDIIDRIPVPSLQTALIETVTQRM